MIKPGTIAMRSGKWTIDTAYKGFRAKRETLDNAFIRRHLFRYSGLAEGLLNSRLSFWIDQLRNGVDKKELARDIRYRAKETEGKLKLVLTETAQWLSMMGQVKYGG